MADARGGTGDDDAQSAGADAKIEAINRAARVVYYSWRGAHGKHHSFFSVDAAQNNATLEQLRMQALEQLERAAASTQLDRLPVNGDAFRLGPQASRTQDLDWKG